MVDAGAELDRVFLRDGPRHSLRPDESALRPIMPKAKIHVLHVLDVRSRISVHRSEDPRFVHRAGAVLLAVLVAIVIPVTARSASGKNAPGKPSRPASALGQPFSALLDINNLSVWASADGRMERQPQSLTAGVAFPPGTSTVIYAGGFIWGGSVNDGASPALRVGGQEYKIGTEAGPIVRPGVPEDPDNAGVRIYRIRRDWATADLTQDAAQYFGLAVQDVSAGDIQALRDQYRRDWLEWPWQLGAPYYERNGVPGYQPDSAGVVDSTTDEPGLGSADQVIWYVANDLDPTATRNLFGSPPIGLEMQVTCWGYNHIPGLENVIFERYRLIYKGTATTPPTARIDPFYLAKWADPDVGDFSDDFAGCSPQQNLGYAYNSGPVDDQYVRYNLPPPAVGYVLLEGPRVPSPGGTGHWNLQPIVGYQNQPMTAFTYFTADTRTQDYQGSVQSWWNMLRGYQPAPPAPPACMIDPTTGQCTNFELTGDPVTFDGWIDGKVDPAGDRRIALMSGPSALALGDTQEVVLGLVAALGKNNRDAVTVLKSTTDHARDAFNFDFQFPAAIPQPHVRVVELDNKLILDWESDTSRIRQIEGYQSQGYRFESYNVYQYPLATSTPQQAISYMSFDPTQPRYLQITTDGLRNRPLVNGQKYYFAVTARMFNPDPAIVQQRIESPVQLLECTPHSPNPGTVYPYTIGEVIQTSRNIVGHDDATVSASYYDPSRPDGHLYKVLFHRASDPMTDINEKPKWDLIDSTSGDTLLRRLFADVPPQRIITKGFSIQVSLPLHGLKGVYQTTYGGRGDHDPVFNVPNPENNYMVVGGGSSQLDTIQGGNVSDNDIEWRFAGDSSWALFLGPTAPASRWVRVPYTAWEMRIYGTDTVRRQIYTTVDAEGQDSVWRASVLLDRAFSGQTLRVFYPVTFVNDSIATGSQFIGGQYYDDVTTRPDGVYIRGFLWVNGQAHSEKVAVRSTFIADLDGDGIAAPSGTTIRFERYKEVRNGDSKLFLPAAVDTDNVAAAQREVDRVNVFPNPYYGMNRAEINRLQHFVTFNHLPWQATIRIFNIAGILVKTITKEDDSQFATWDLNNENGLQAGGGLYLAYIEMKDRSGADLGSKVLKLMIVPMDQSPGSQ